MVYLGVSYLILKDGSDKILYREKKKYGIKFFCWFFIVGLGFYRLFGFFIR